MSLFSILWCIKQLTFRHEKGVYIYIYIATRLFRSYFGLCVAA